MDQRGIEPHVKLMDKSERTDGTLSRSDFVFDGENNLYVCPGGKELKIPPPVLQAPRGPDEGRHAHLLRQKARLRRLRAQAKVLPEHAGAQDRALRS